MLARSDVLYLDGSPLDDQAKALIEEAIGNAESEAPAQEDLDRMTESDWRNDSMFMLLDGTRSRVLGLITFLLSRENKEKGNEEAAFWARIISVTSELRCTGLDAVLIRALAEHAHEAGVDKIIFQLTRKLQRAIAYIKTLTGPVTEVHGMNRVFTKDGRSPAVATYRASVKAILSGTSKAIDSGEGDMVLVHRGREIDDPNISL